MTITIAKSPREAFGAQMFRRGEHDVPQDHTDATLDCGVASADVARMWVAGPTQARAVVSVAVMVAATVADEAARAAGE